MRPSPLYGTIAASGEAGAAGYLEQERSPHDRRSVRIRLSPKGLDLCEKIGKLQDAHGMAISAGGDGCDIESACRTLRRLERRWSDYVQFGPA